jgi:hypothetical protein
LKSEDERWVEEGPSDNPNFVWFRHRDGEYTRVGVDAVETKASVAERFCAPTSNMSTIMSDQPSSYREFAS